MMSSGLDGNRGGGAGRGGWVWDTGHDLTYFFGYDFPFEAIVLVTCFDYSPVFHVLFWVLFLCIKYKYAYISSAFSSSEELHCVKT